MTLAMTKRNLFRYAMPLKALIVWGALCFSDYITIVQLFACLYNTYADSVFYFTLLYGTVGRGSSVGIACLYGLDGPGIESRLGARFSAPVQTAPGAHPASCTMGTGSFPGVNWPGRGVDHLPPSSVEVKVRVERYLYSPSGPSWPAVRWTFIVRY